MHYAHKRTFDLSAKKKAFLETRLREEGIESMRSDRIVRRQSGEAAPLSFAQQRLWFLDQLAPGSPFYNLPVAVRLRGPLLCDALVPSLNALMQRHETLRTTFAVVDGQPVQWIAADQKATLPLIDLRGLDPAQRAALAKRLTTEAAQQPFDLARGPLFRALLLRLDAQEHVLLLTMHHAISDGWSVEVLFRELGALYSAAHAQRPALLPPLPIQYADYAIWQRAQLSGAALETQLFYWKSQLAGAPALLELPTDHSRPPVQAFDGAVHSFTLPKEIREKLTALSRQEGATLFMTLLAAWQTLLHRYSGQRDIVVGTPIAGRTRSEVEPLVGFFANTLAIRASLAGNPSFRTLLGRVRAACLGAYAHQDLPFEKLVEELQLERSLSFNPLFQALFALQEEPSADAQFAGLTLESFPVNSGTAKVDISLMLKNSDQGLVGTLTGGAALFDPATIVHMAGHFQTLLKGICANPDRRLADLPITTEAELRLRASWNDTQAEYPAHACIHELFEAQVERTPDAIALAFAEPTPADDGRACDRQSPEPQAFGPQQLTYAELNRRANRLAHRLREMGVGPEVRVGLCMERSPEMIVGLLAILKAGGGYVPLDPAYPPERLMYMLADAQAPALLTQQRLVDRLPGHTAQTLCLDRVDPPAGAAHDRNLSAPATPDQLAYVIYTSGSTGKPKGIMIRHRGVCNVIPASIAAFGVSASSRVLQMASLSFDASVLEIFTALLSGATLHLVAAEAIGAPNALAQLMQRHAISQIALPPSLLEVLPHGAFPALETIIVGGEHCSAETLRRWAPGRRFINAYAPTEATIYATAWRGVEAPPQGPPLGRPIANMQAYVLDANLQPTPTNVPGEIHLGGVGVARGYLGRPELTAARFIPNPFAPSGSMPANAERRLPTADCRLYKTGDLARYRSDGSLEFLGRVDTQVKVRGFRIELGEIETTLAKHPALREAVVTVREDAPGDKRIVAYVVPTEPTIAATSMAAVAHRPPSLAVELRDFLKERLPAYMIPSAFVTLAALPLTENGKVHYRALPATDSGRSDLGTTFVAPRNPTEGALAEIWARLLGKQQVGIHDNFFELGGHSLLVTRLILTVRDTMNVDLPLRHLFETPTIAGLSIAIEERRGKARRDDDDTLAAYLNREALLDPAIRPSAPHTAPLTPPSRILLTGATGFLGGFLLYELLRQTSADIYCMVRAQDAEAGKRKLQRQLESCELWDARFSQRIVAVPGNLDLPLFGMEEAQFRMLGATVEAIYHNGAQVNFIYPYERLRATNVLGTQEVLRLACSGAVKPVHYISTLSVFPSYGCTEPTYISERSEPDSCEGLYSGYAQSKWVADRLVRAARDRGVPVCIYRPATVSGESAAGRVHPDDYTARLIKGCIQLGSARDYERNIYLTPVDFVSKAIVYLSQQTNAYGRAFHLINPRPIAWSELVAWIRAAGYPLTLCTFDEWRMKLSAAVRDSQDNGLYPFVTMFFDERVAEMERGNWFRFLEFDCTATLAALEGSGISCPPVDATLLRTYFSYFVLSGFLPAPVRVAGSLESERRRRARPLAQPAFG